jgi:hypothetical protein
MYPTHRCPTLRHPTLPYRTPPDPRLLRAGPPGGAGEAGGPADGVRPPLPPPPVPLACLSGSGGGRHGGGERQHTRVAAPVWETLWAQSTGQTPRAQQDWSPACVETARQGLISMGTRKRARCRAARRWATRCTTSTATTTRRQSTASRCDPCRAWRGEPREAGTCVAQGSARQHETSSHGLAADPRRPPARSFVKATGSVSSVSAHVHCTCHRASPPPPRRTQVLKRLPNLKKLDGIPVDVDERDQAMQARGGT